MAQLTDELKEKLSNIKFLGLDVDGVLTDGGVYLDGSGNFTRRFFIKDGLGIKVLMAANVEVGIITFAKNEAVYFRADQLGITEVHINAADKAQVLDDIRSKKGLSWEQVAFMGDDLIDIKAMQQAGLACAPSDAIQMAKDVADWISSYAGGNGAVRELCEQIIDSLGLDPLELLKKIESHN